MNQSDIAAYWNTPDAVERNRRDTILKQLEIRAISAHVRDGMRILDVGCGDGETAVALLTSGCKRLNITGVDASVAMLKAAEDRAYRANAYVEKPPPLKDINGIAFAACNVADLGKWARGRRPFDLIYTERCLINLPSWEAQKRAIQDICSLLKPGGIYLMVEHSQDGLDETNALRATLGLPAIVPPEFNRYLRNDEIVRLWMELTREALYAPDDLRQETSDFAGTYYFLSRIVNAKLAADAGVEPDYDAPINTLALSLPLGPGPGGFRGYSRLYCFRKAR